MKLKKIIKSVKRVLPNWLIDISYQSLSLAYKIHYKIKFPQNKSKLFIRKRTSDAGMFNQIWIKKEYDIFKKVNPKVIVDAGANVGYASLWFTHKYPNAKIFAIEPEDSNFKILSKNTKQYNHIILIHAGLWNKDTNLKIINKKSSKCSFMTQEVKPLEDYDFKTVQLNEIIKKINGKNIDILKIDIEGSEKEVFSLNTEWLSKVNIIIIELHEKRKPGCKKAIYSILNKKGWSEYKKGENNIFIRKKLLKNNPHLVKYDLMKVLKK